MVELRLVTTLIEEVYTMDRGVYAIAKPSPRPNNWYMQDRRSEPRYAVREGALVWDPSRDTAGSQETTIVDLSRNGIRLLADREFAKGAQVTVDFRGMVICGTVQHCAPSENRFAAGVCIGGVLDQVSQDYGSKDAA